MSQAQLQKKVEDYLRKSHALEEQWQWPLCAEQLQAAMDRMAKQTRQPEVLHELFEAGLGSAGSTASIRISLLFGRTTAGLGVERRNQQDGPTSKPITVLEKFLAIKLVKCRLTVAILRTLCGCLLPRD